MNVASGSKKSQLQINVVGVEGLKHAGMQKLETFITEISARPFINFVWIAALLIVGGSILALAIERRLNQKNI
jgi:cytochrome c biogenesis factor